MQNVKTNPARITAMDTKTFQAPPGIIRRPERCDRPVADQPQHNADDHQQGHGDKDGHDRSDAEAAAAPG